jgi:hypothetical protein
MFFSDNSTFFLLISSLISFNSSLCNFILDYSEVNNCFSADISESLFSMSSISYEVYSFEESLEIATKPYNLLTFSSSIYFSYSIALYLLSINESYYYNSFIDVLVCYNSITTFSIS